MNPLSVFDQPSDLSDYLQNNANISEDLAAAIVGAAWVETPNGHALDRWTEESLSKLINKMGVGADKAREAAYSAFAYGRRRLGNTKTKTKEATMNSKNNSNITLSLYPYAIASLTGVARLTKARDERRLVGRGRARGAPGDVFDFWVPARPLRSHRRG